MVDLSKFATTTPYASELAGVFQPLLGWHSAMAEEWVAIAVADRFRRAVGALARDGRFDDDPDFRPWQLREVGPLPRVTDSPVTARIAALVRERAGDRRSLAAEDWRDLLGDAAMHDVLMRTVRAQQETPDGQDPARAEAEDALGEADAVQMRRKVFATVAVLQQLAEQRPDALDRLFLHRTADWQQTLPAIDPLVDFPVAAVEAVLAPVGLLHSYRQYFFEFDSFLGPPVGHVWLSPGGTVELVEVNVRRTLTERTTEIAQESTVRSETSVTQEDELSDAVKQDTADDVKLGVNVSAGFNMKVYHGEASSSFAFSTSRKNSAEITHRRKRSQSEKLSSEIRKSYKTTFRTLTEVTDTSSRRYVLANSSEKLVNYELRRKMRRVGVQLQHIASQLCWQMYIDEPGRDLATSQLVHVASPKDADAGTPPPDQPAALAPKDLPFTVQFAFIDLRLATEDADETFDGGWHKPDVGKDSHIQNVQTFAYPPPPGYQLDDVQINGFTRADPGKDLPDPFVPHLKVADPAAGSFTIDVSSVNFHEQPYIPINLNLRYVGTAAAAQKAKDDYADVKAVYDAGRQRKQHEAYVSAVRDRVKLAGQVLTRPESDLREEERHIVYRHLISRLTATPPSANPHVTSELVRRLFDADAMLYFVAPDWWAPRSFVAQELANATTGTPTDPFTLGSDDLVGWGGVRDTARHKYLVTEDSRPAPMGASLGWLLQLDGDARRNAFLNSAWVKAVLPIRAGRELEAIAWLEKENVEGADGLDDAYLPQPQDPPEFTGKSIREVLALLADQVAALQQQAAQVDPTAGTFPGEVVFEHGFDPLAGGTRLDADPLVVFDQWLEVLPTDQVVAVEYQA